jgi:hypothetical protein
MRRRSLINSYNLYPPSGHSERCDSCDFVQEARKVRCSCSHHRQRQQISSDEDNLLNSICFGDKQSLGIPLRNEYSQSDMLLVKEMQLKTQQMVQLMNKSSISSERNNIVSPDLSISNSYSTANDSSDDYFLSRSFDNDEIDEALDSGRSGDFDREFESSVEEIDHNKIIDSITYNSREDDDAIFYFEP